MRSQQAAKGGEVTTSDDPPDPPDPPKKLFVKISPDTDELEEFLARNPGAKFSLRIGGKSFSAYLAERERRRVPDRRNPPAARGVHMDRIVEPLERQEVGNPGDDGLTVRLRCRVSPPGTEHVFKVAMGYTVGSSRDVSRRPTGSALERALDLLQAAAVRKIADDPRTSFPAEDEFSVTRDDLARVPADR